MLLYTNTGIYGECEASNLGNADNALDSEFQERITGLRCEAKEQLFDITYLSIYTRYPVYFLNRTEHTESLVKLGFCTERFKNYAVYADYYNKSMIIDVLRRAAILGVNPAKVTNKSEIHDIIQDLEKNRLRELTSKVALLGLTEQARRDSRVIYEYLYRIYYGASAEGERNRLAYLFERGMISKRLYKQMLEKCR